MQNTEGLNIYRKNFCVKNPTPAGVEQTLVPFSINI